MLINPVSGLCLTVPIPNPPNGTQLTINNCNGGDNQRFYLPGTKTPSGASVAGTGTVTSGISGHCMDAYGTSDRASNGQIVAINGCNSNASQNWTVWSNENVSAWGLCLDTVGEGTANDTLVQLETCVGAASQVWAQQPNGSLLNTNSGRCLDDPGFSTTAGTQLMIHDCNGGDNQQWALPTTKASSGGSACDIYAHYGTPCVAAYSTTRAVLRL